ncbi:Occludin/ELL domain-containing protein 1 [Saguinus oedipus]|uniref:Occludin/ELL domain-containing protein 1 n=1 Tax=Saguinus oedipus TaxID=9490 RepID=A0ABQ9U7W2_SAGOE|nr:Occludin/ELL domain-containing protein 1 [Saguinus oedipus]
MSFKYPLVSSARERSRYAAVFQDQYRENLELQREMGCAQAKLRQLEARLSSLPPPQSQKEARVAARVWREFEKKQMDPGFLDKQARCHYLKGKLRHLKTQIQKFGDRGDRPLALTLQGLQISTCSLEIGPALHFSEINMY